MDTTLTFTCRASSKKSTKTLGLRLCGLAVFCGTLLWADTSVMAQPTLSKVNPSPVVTANTWPTLNLSAVAKTEVTHDELHATLSITSIGTNIQENQRFVTDATRAALSLLNTSPDIKVSSQSTRTHPHYTMPREKVHQQRFVTTLTLAVRSTNTTALLDMLNKAMNHTDYKFEVEYHPMTISDELREKELVLLREQVAKEFQGKANSMSRSLGFSRAEIVELHLQEENGFQVRPVPMRAQKMAVMEMATPAMGVAPSSGTLSITLHGQVRLIP